ncbi:MAG: glycosyltransferase family 4 protein [Anaerolineae bacterium]|nr:glycosyltransferase family 4 protein [Anaerolineae bacterium]
MPPTSSSIIGIDASRAVSAAPTGTEAYSTHLIRALRPRLASTHTLRLYYREMPPFALDTPASGPQTARSEAAVETRVIPFPRLWTHLRLSWEMVRHPPDLLFVPAHVLPVVRPRRTLVTVHDLGYRLFPEAYPASQRRYLELSTRWNVRVATHILADSEATRDAIIEAYDVPAQKLTVVYPGYEPDLKPVRDCSEIERVRRRYSIPGDYVLSIGRIQPRKNLTRLIEAFSRVLADHPNLTLVLAGPTGWLGDPIQARATTLRVADRVIFPGYVAPEDKAALISGARLFAYPSLCEGFGFPVLEAQACGTPLLTSTTSSLPEVTGEGGLLVDPLDVEAIADGLRRLLDDQARGGRLSARLVTQGFENLARFSWEMAARQVQDVITALLEP